MKKRTTKKKAAKEPRKRSPLEVAREQVRRLQKRCDDLKAELSELRDIEAELADEEEEQQAKLEDLAEVEREIDRPSYLTLIEAVRRLKSERDALRAQVEAAGS